MNHPKSARRSPETPYTSEHESQDAAADQVDAHRAMVLWLFLATLIVSIILSALLWTADPTKSGNPGESTQSSASILLVVVLAGALGAFVSCLKRLYAFDNVFPRRPFAILFKKFNAYLLAYATIPPLVGMIAAALVYVVFAGEMIRGPLFPVFTCSQRVGDLCHNLPDVLGYWSPASAQDYAKAVVWGFVSGFSERFSVDILNQFGAKGLGKQDVK